MTEVERKNKKIKPILIEKEKLLALPAEERKKILDKGIWIQYPFAEKLISRFEELLHQPKRHRMEGRTLIGPTSNGKTSIVEEFIEIQRQKSGMDENSYYEILRVEAPEIPSVKSLYIEIFSKCNMFHMARSGTAEQLKQDLIKLLRKLNVKMLFIDEIHNLLTAQNDRILKQILNALKGLANRLRIPIVLIGTEEAKDIIQRDDQVLERYEIIYLNNWKKNGYFKLLLKTFENALPLREQSNLHEPEIAEIIYNISEGIIGKVSKIIRKCGKEAIDRGTEKITKQLIIDIKNEKISS